MRKFILSSIVVTISIFSIAQPYKGYVQPDDDESGKSAGCAAASTSLYMELNNVSALIHTGGNLWQIRSQNRAHYEVPKGSGIMSLFASALWLGGQDVNGQLKLAALRYRDGNDYWTGPLSNNNAEISPSDCIKYDKIFHTKQDEIREFDAWYTAGEQDQLNGTNTQSEEFPNYIIPDIIKEWPAHGDASIGQDHFLAPFYDRNNDQQYNYQDGDYPWYDFYKDVDCKTDRTVTLFGDETNWWVMNDKGNIHTETGADPIGMEVRAQAFAFATNDEINNMTFYNYELINRSTQTLHETYFGVFVDVALGGAFDDYVGCDVGRGLGYAYNGNAVDLTESGFLGYGENPPAVGVDFFEGPYQDNDNIDNQIGIGLNEAVEGNGIGFGDGIIDNERFGMRRFLYYNNLGAGNANQTDPTNATDYYNYLRGIWKDGTRFVYGGTGHVSDPEANASVECDFMFPGDTDPLGWGTGGIPQPTWTEQTAGNFPYDRRFVQSAGPFKLDPGAVNNITVGVVWARATAGDPFASVRQLQKADDKAQALFENCFKVLEGPHAPDMDIQEMENELILTLSNKLGSNNFNELYQEEDPFIILDSTIQGDNIYKFQGYQIYQVKSPNVSASELGNSDLARLAYQCDINDNIINLVNWELDQKSNVLIPEIKVVAANNGIKHSLSIKNDLFAQGDDALINHQPYYFIAISYATNIYKPFDPLDPTLLDGQKKPYISSRKGPIGEIQVITGIPHKPNVEAGGTDFNTNFGDYLPITKVDGKGCGPNWMKLHPESENEILKNGSVNKIKYTKEGPPILIKVIDPLNVPNADFSVRFIEDSETKADSATWMIINETDQDTIKSENTITLLNEHLIPKWGISVLIEHNPLVCRNNANNCQYRNRDVWPIGASITFSDSSKQWLSGLYDTDQYNPTNWILSGAHEPEVSDPPFPNFMDDPFSYKDIYDREELYENLVGGSFAPAFLTKTNAEMPGRPFRTSSPYYLESHQTTLAHMNNIDIVITKDKSKWTRCPVLEMGANHYANENNQQEFGLRLTKSIDKNGLKQGDPGYNASEGGLVSDSSMGWFPGYAIDLDNGKRLNLFYGENSWLAGDNGRDMMWNPSPNIASIDGYQMGGMHVLYIMTDHEDLDNQIGYDAGAFAYNNFKQEHVSYYRNVMKKVNWIGYPLGVAYQDWLSSDVRIELRVHRPFEKYMATGENNTMPMFKFSTRNFSAITNQSEVVASVLDEINVVPNPYYAYSKYEANKIDSRIKFVNLPEQCTISIFNVRGKRVKQIKKDNPLTYQDWDIKNHAGIPVSSGMFIVHIEIPGVGEKILKSFISVRETSFENF